MNGQGYPTYLVHFNKNHDPKNGRFTFGDGDGDGQVGDTGSSNKKEKSGGFLGLFKKKESPSDLSYVKSKENSQKVHEGLDSGKTVSEVKKEITGSTNPDDYRTPELDKKYNELEQTGMFDIYKFHWLRNDDDAEKEWGKDKVKIADIGIKALNKTRYKGDFNDYDSLDNAHKNADRSWFMFEDQTFGMPEISYLVYNGWSKEKIIDMFRTTEAWEELNNKYQDSVLTAKNISTNDKNWFEEFSEAFESSPYKRAYMLNEAYWMMNGSREDGGEIGTFADACKEVMEEMSHSDSSDYIEHFNKNHSKANGQFVSGDGDGDGIIDDHHHYSTNVRKKSAPSETKSSTSKFKSTLGSKEVHKDAVKKAVIATAATAAVVGAAAIIIKAVGDKDYTQYSLEADNGRKWIEAGDFYRASSAKVVGGDW